MIKINNKEYKCLECQYHNVDGVEHLSIMIEGALLNKDNKLEIEYGSDKYEGVKNLPRYRNGITYFLVYLDGVLVC